MKRRDFLRSAALLGTAAAMPFAAQTAFAGAAHARTFKLARSASAVAGSRFAALDVAPCVACDADTLRVRIDAMHRAEGAPVLHELWLSAMFDDDLAGRIPFLAWQFVHGTPPRMSQRVSFVAGRDRMRGFELEFRLPGDAQCRRESCALTRLDAPALSPGHYVLLGPRRDGGSVDAAVLCHSGDPCVPLGPAPRDFDYLALRIEAAA